MHTLRIYLFAAALLALAITPWVAILIRATAAIAPTNGGIQ